MHHCSLYISVVRPYQSYSKWYWIQCVYWYFPLYSSSQILYDQSSYVSSISLYFLDTPLVLYCYLSHTYTQLCLFNQNSKEGHNADQQSVDNNSSISLVNKTVNGFQYNDYTVYAGSLDQNFWVHVFLLFRVSCFRLLLQPSLCLETLRSWMSFIITSLRMIPSLALPCTRTTCLLVPPTNWIAMILIPILVLSIWYIPTPRISTVKWSVCTSVVHLKLRVSILCFSSFLDDFIVVSCCFFEPTVQVFNSQLQLVYSFFSMTTP